MDSFAYTNNEFAYSGELLYRINRAGSGKVNADFCIERNSSYPYCVIHYVAKGSGEVVYRGKKQLVQKGQCFVLNSFEGHCYRTAPNDTFELNWMEFNGGDSTKLVGTFLSFFSPVMDEAKSRIINKYMLRIFSCLENNKRNCDIYISKIIYIIIMCLFAESGNILSNDLSASKACDIQRVKSHIDGNLNESLSMVSLAKIINYNPQYFAKLFKKYTGFTPAKYILDRRISSAKELLSSGDIQIDLLAEELGFCNASHFIRIFKKAEGLTPAEFRNESISYFSTTMKLSKLTLQK